MSGIHTYKNLSTLVTWRRQDLNQQATISQKNAVKSPPTILLTFAYNCTGKTRLSMEFKDAGKRKNNGSAKTFYFSAFTEDLFTWENDLDVDLVCHLRLHSDSSFFNGLKELAVEQTTVGYQARCADFDLDIDYTAWRVTPATGATS